MHNNILLLFKTQILTLAGWGRGLEEGNRQGGRAEIDTSTVYSISWEHIDQQYTWAELNQLCLYLYIAKLHISSETDTVQKNILLSLHSHCRVYIYILNVLDRVVVVDSFCCCAFNGSDYLTFLKIRVLYYDYMHQIFFFFFFFFLFFFLRLDSVMSSTLCPAQQFPSNYFSPACELSSYKFLYPLELPLRHLSI
jgi:hypothetical protein